MTTKTGETYEGMLAETVNFTSQNGDLIGGYMARPLGGGPYPGVVLIHEPFGLLEHDKEQARKFAHHGYVALAIDLYYREGPGDLAEIAAQMRQRGGLPDSRLIADMEGAVSALRTVASCSGKVGCIGHCAAGRQTLLFACNTQNLDAAVDCYGGRVVTDEVTEAQPRPVIEMVADLSCPLLGLFGESDQNPSPQHVARLEEELKKHSKVYEFKSYPPDVGHGFFADWRPSYRPEAAVDGWQQIFGFFGRYLS